MLMQPAARIRISFRKFSFLVPALFLSATIFFFACQPKELTTAKIYIQNGDWDRALQHLEKAVEEYPKNSEAHFLLGQEYGRRARYEDMNRQFQISSNLSNKFEPQIVAERERHWVEKFNDGITAQYREDYEIARESFEKAILIDSLKYEAHQKLAINYLKTDDFENAIMIYEKLIDKNPKDINLLVSLANLYYSQKEYEQVVVHLKKVLELEPDNRDALANLALSYDFLDQKENAYQSYVKGIAANPQDKDLIFLFGVHHYNHKLFEKAIQLFEQVLELNPNDFESTSNIGNAYLSMAEELRQQLRKSKNAGNAAVEINKIRDQSVSNYKKAIPYLEKALEMQTDHPNLWRNLGIAYVQTGDVKKGEAAFLKAEEIKLKMSN